MSDVLCLRPLEDFHNVGVTPPAGLNIQVVTPDDPGLAGAMKTAEALVIPAVGPALDASLFEGSGIRLVQVTGAGVDRFDCAALAKLGIMVANVPGASAAAVAEYVVGAASALLRFMPENTAAILSGDYAAVRSRTIGRGLNQLGGLCVGIVGYGVIGQATAAHCTMLGAKVIFFDPMVDGDGKRDLPDLLATADVVSLHMPLIDSTRGLIGSTEFGLMKPGAILVNAARGGIVDEAALAAALENAQIGGAAVDVFSTEPPEADNPLLNVSDAARSRLILTPHIAGVTRQAWAVLFSEAWDNVARLLITDEPVHHQI